MKSKYFYIKQDNEIRGPFLASTLDKLFAAGSLSADTPVSADKVSWSTLEKTLYIIHDQSPQKRNVPLKVTLAAGIKKDDDPIVLLTDPTEESSSSESSDAELEEEKEDLEDCVWEVMGETLHLMWNTPDKWESITHFSHKSIIRILLPTCLLFTLLVTQTAAVSIAFFWEKYLFKMLFVFSFTGIAMVLYFVENLLLSCKNKKKEKQERWRYAVILSGMSWINFGAVTCVGSLHFALTVLTGQGGMPTWVVWISTSFFLFVCCFFFANMAAGLRIGLCSFFGYRPRNAVWFSALFIWQYFLLLYAGYLAAKKMII